VSRIKKNRERDTERYNRRVATVQMENLLCDLFCGMRTVTGKRFLFYIGPLVIYACIIFLLSSLSKQPEKLSFIFNYDKLLHTVEYFILGYLLMRVVTTSPHTTVSRRSKVITVVIGLTYAISDEWHQSFVPGRHSSIVDVWFDVLGVAVAAWTFEMIRYRLPVVSRIETRIADI